jgi:short-subunit dehydrogenase
MEKMVISVVAGATGDIGEEFVSSLCARGDRVIAIARSSEKLEALRNNYNQIDPIAICDISKLNGLRIDNLIICIGEHFSGNFFDNSYEDYQSSIASNFLEPIKIFKLLQDSLAEGSNIVFLNSAASKSPSPSEGPYGVAKSALTKFIESTAYFGRQRKLNIVNVIFGAAQTKMTLNRADYTNLIAPKELVESILSALHHYPSLMIRSIEIERRRI